MAAPLITGLKDIHHGGLLLTKFLYKHQFIGYGCMATCVVYISNACFLMEMNGDHKFAISLEKTSIFKCFF